ncbi:hypothetical protein OG883_19615 [Streptomyces sp. NBC_01142]|uniref:hypothetical protein n=1 Tax=Streptomyces sp. NBC_01142 TaxID=2975865 RepID=UPI00224E8F30|nr:hypothetical protein [Streptomyces sp. NBC_01142]MCX4822054.1 hypothetical protein [Streptomyces sp. NBC_01142]
MRVDWARLGTVVAVVAGIGTLLFTGVATYYQALVVGDQLEQSRDDAKRDKQDQASRVSFWEDLDGTNPDAWELHLMNRSPDPVSNLELVLSVRTRPRGEDPAVHFVNVDDLNLAPCSEVVLTEEHLKYYVEGKLEPVDSAAGALIAFVDRDAVGWVRTAERLYSGDEFEEELGKAPEFYAGRLVGRPHVKQVTTCGDGTK